MKRADREKYRCRAVQARNTPWHSKRSARPEGTRGRGGREGGMGWGVQFSFKNSNLKTDITIFRASDNLVGFWCPVNTSHTRLVLLQFCNLLERLAVKCKHVHIVVVWRHGNHCGKEGGERREEEGE